MASDEFGGRAPGTPGEQKTVEYLTQRFASLGLEPGGEDGDWTQTGPMIRTRIQLPATMRFSVEGEVQPLEQRINVEVSTVRATETIRIDAPVVFVGFGANAPEREWDDYGDIDLEGKIALFLVNDLDFVAPSDEPVADRLPLSSAVQAAKTTLRPAMPGIRTGIFGEPRRTSKRSG